MISKRQRSRIQRCERIVFHRDRATQEAFMLLQSQAKLRKLKRLQQLHEIKDNTVAVRVTLMVDRQLFD